MSQYLSSSQRQARQAEIDDLYLTWTASLPKTENEYYDRRKQAHDKYLDYENPLPYENEAAYINRRKDYPCNKDYRSKDQLHDVYKAFYKKWPNLRARKELDHKDITKNEAFPGIARQSIEVTGSSSSAPARGWLVKDAQSVSSTEEESPPRHKNNEPAIWAVWRATKPADPKEEEARRKSSKQQWSHFKMPIPYETFEEFFERQKTIGLGGRARDDLKNGHKAWFQAGVNKHLCFSYQKALW